MVLSEMIKNSIATIGIIAGIMIATMFISEMPAGLGIFQKFGTCFQVISFRSMGPLDILCLRVSLRIRLHRYFCAGW